MTQERQYEVINARAEVLEKQGHFQLADALREQARLILLQMAAQPTNDDQRIASKSIGGGLSPNDLEEGALPKPSLMPGPGVRRADRAAARRLGRSRA